MSFLFSPMEQFLISPLFSFHFSISNVVFYLFLATFFTLSLHFLRSHYILTNNWGLLNESLMRSILLMLEDTLGPKFSIFLPLFYSLFHFILFSNLLGLVPYSTTSTVEFVLTISLSSTLILGFFLLGLLNHKILFFSMFLPSGTPAAIIFPIIFIEILTNIIKIFSLALRLAINLITGHLLLRVILGFIWTGYIHGISFFLLAIPILLVTAILCLEILIAYLQSYIFIFIAILTLKDFSL